MKEFLWIPRMLTDISAFCADNSFPETKAALDVALKAFTADVELNQMRKGLVFLGDEPGKTRSN